MPEQYGPTLPELTESQIVNNIRENIVPTDFTRSEYDALFKEWQTARAAWIAQQEAEDPENFGNMNTYTAFFERDVYGHIPTTSGVYEASGDEGDVSKQVFLAQWEKGAEALRAEEEAEMNAYSGGSNNSSSNKKINLRVAKASPIPASTVTTASAALRYPSAKSQSIGEDSDYVTFQFYTYAPPFRKRALQSTTGESAGQTVTAQFYDYNQASDTGEANQYAKSNALSSIVMYMPEDVSTGFRSNWTGKAFSNVASDMLKTAAGDTFMDKIKGFSNMTFSAVDRTLPLAGAAAIRKLVTKVGGDQITNDDIFGGMSGAILNPNVELMYGGTDLRNFTLKFKLVPKDNLETVTINQILNTFKKAMLPKLDPGAVMGGTSPGTYKGFIGVPDLCRVAFMHGGKEHKYLPRYKMCAITQVDVNYTPDGAYATYYDGQPVAVELTVSFQETKMVFSEEIGGRAASQEGDVEIDGIR